MDIFELVVAGYAAIVSTILAIREISQNRPKLSIIFKYIKWADNQELMITNVGSKPITIKEVGVLIKPSKESIEVGDPNSFTPIFPSYYPDEKIPLPMMLTEGQCVQFHFNVDPNIVLIKNNITVYAKDTTDKVYSTKELFFYDGKYHHEATSPP